MSSGSSGRGHVYFLVPFSPSDAMLLWNGVLWDGWVSSPIHRFDQFTDFGGAAFILLKMRLDSKGILTTQDEDDINVDPILGSDLEGDGDSDTDDISNDDSGTELDEDEEDGGCFVDDVGRDAGAGISDIGVEGDDESDNTLEHFSSEDEEFVQ
ncbi:hypothetical protein Cgig2_011349 [Carnegiea gigantea]|uniref:Uncharacterized protein n=1 Tax=Carnegiea gigantea TaxID=171969 RepID=A0A9Q1KTQ8_9CARY|nr:hypothetical protein Cgig2_011349 [Carnegiea gigantea]